MANLLFGGGTDWGRLASRSEKNRTGIVNLGMDQINAVFSGGSAPFYDLANQPGQKFSSKGTYYSLQGGKFKPFWAPKGARPSGQAAPASIPGSIIGSPVTDPIGGVGNKLLGVDKFINSLFGDDKSPRDIAREKFKKGLLFSGPQEQTFEGFQPEFFDKRAKAYVDYALPQLGDQYRDARDATIYGLSNRGLSNSTIASRANRRLEDTVGEGKQSIAESGINQANQLKKEIEDRRQQTIQQLYQTADPSQAFQSAISSASQFRQPSVFAPLTNMFSNLANQYYINQAIKGYQGQGNVGSQPQYDFSGSLGPVTY